MGRALWEQAEQELVRFVLTPSEALYTGKYQHAEGDLGQPLSPSGLRGVAQRYTVFRATRFIWYPLVTFARRLFAR